MTLAAASVTTWLDETPVVALVARDHPVKVQQFDISGELGILLAIATGALYALAAWFTALAKKRIDEGAPGWEQKHMFWAQMFSLFAMGTGGGFITLAYGSGYPVAFLLAIYASVQLFVNLAVCMWSSLSEFTKPMMVGTAMFAGCTAMLVSASPEPKDVPIAELLSLHAIVFAVVWLSIWAGALCSLRRLSDEIPRHPGKVWAWSMAVTGVAFITDQWGRVMGSDEVQPTIWWWVLALTIFIPASAVAYLSIKAFEVTDVAIFVPTALCIQLVANVIGGYFLWGDGADLEDPFTYLLGYVLILLSVYLSSPEMDLMAGFLQSQEYCSAKLSSGVAKTSFGRSILRMVKAFGELEQPPESPEDATKKAHDAFKEALLIGCQEGTISPEELIDLSAHLWAKKGDAQGGAAEIVEWLAGRKYFQDYFEKDPLFKDNMIGTSPKLSAGNRDVELQSHT